MSFQDLRAAQAIRFSAMMVLYATDQHAFKISISMLVGLAQDAKEISLNHLLMIHNVCLQNLRAVQAIRCSVMMFRNVTDQHAFRISILI